MDNLKMVMSGIGLSLFFCFLEGGDTLCDFNNLISSQHPTLYIMNLIYLGATWSLLCTYCTVKTQTEATIYVNRCERARIKKIISTRHLSTLLLRSNKQKEKNRNRSWAAELVTVNCTMPSSLSAFPQMFWSFASIASCKPFCLFGFSTNVLISTSFHTALCIGWWADGGCSLQQ